MHASAETTLGRARLSFADTAEIDEFVRVLDLYERGELSPDQWRAFRLVRGTYGQRQSGDVQMIRVKIPQGILEAQQLDALADVAETWSRGFGHITTRQNVQFHFLKLHDVEKAMRRLAEAGLTCREACGSAVRNVTACPYAGVAEDEVFDVTPYAEALTRHLLRHPLSSSLPRKFKIAFEGCPEDHVFTAINDLGWRARVREANGRVERGFRLTVGGGTSILPTSGRVLFDFLPAGEILDVAEAVIRVFHRLGDFKHKQRNRMKFLIRNLGWDVWRAEFEARARARCAPRAARACPSSPDDPPVEQAPAGERAQAPAPEAVAARAASAVLTRPGPAARRRAPCCASSTPSSRRWARTNVRPQRQAGYSVVSVTVPLGDLTARADAPAGRPRPSLRRRHRAHVPEPGPALPLGPHARRARSPRAPGRGGPPARRLEHGGRRDELPGRGGLPAGGHAVARPRQGLLRPPRRPARDRGRGGRPRHQDQRLPERLRPAPRGGPRLPGQRAPGGGQGGAPVLRHGGGRRPRGRGPLRPARGQGARPSHDRGPRPSPRPSSARSARPASPRAPSSAASRWRG